jgi:hypothetical protein
VTFTSASGNFLSTGNTTLTITAGQSVGLMSDGTNWKVFAGKGSGGGTPGGSSGQIQINSTGTFAGTPTGAGVLTALGIAPASVGGMLLSGGSLGTPSGGTLTNETGLPIAGISGLGSGWTTALAATYSAGGGCSGSFCALTAGSNWTTALAATLASTVASGLAVATNSGSGALASQAAAITTGDCLKWGPGVQDAGAACGSGGGSTADQFLGAKSGTFANMSSTYWEINLPGTGYNGTPNATPGIPIAPRSRSSTTSSGLTSTSLS